MVCHRTQGSLETTLSFKKNFGGRKCTDGKFSARDRRCAKSMGGPFREPIEGRRVQWREVDFDRNFEMDVSPGDFSQMDGHRDTAISRFVHAAQWPQ